MIEKDDADGVRTATIPHVMFRVQIPSGDEPITTCG